MQPQPLNKFSVGDKIKTQVSGVVYRIIMFEDKKKTSAICLCLEDNKKIRINIENVKFYKVTSNDF